MIAKEGNNLPNFRLIPDPGDSVAAEKVVRKRLRGGTQTARSPLSPSFRPGSLEAPPYLVSMRRTQSVHLMTQSGFAHRTESIPSAVTSPASCISHLAGDLLSGVRAFRYSQFGELVGVARHPRAQTRFSARDLTYRLKSIALTWFFQSPGGVGQTPAHSSSGRSGALRGAPAASLQPLTAPAVRPFTK